MKGYSVTISEVSKELSAKERVYFKDTTSAIKLDEATQGQEITINPDYFGILTIHNEKSDDKEYENYIIVDKSGDKYVTGSLSFWTSFVDIAEEMQGSDEEWGVKVYRVPSKNYKGKDFITCSII